MSGNGRLTKRSTPFTIAGIYILLGVIWISASDSLALLIAGNASNFEIIQTIKGWLFVFISGLVIYLMVRNRLQAIDRVSEERERTRLSLAASEDKYRNLFATMTLGVIYQDAEGRIISANPAAERILGIRLGEMREHTSTSPVWKAVREDGSPFPGEEHPSMVALKSGREIHDVLMGLNNLNSGETRWIKINAVPQLAEGQEKPHSVYTLFEDVTSLTYLQRQLKASAETLSSIIEASPFAIFDLDSEARVRSIWNRAAERMFGFSAEEAIGNFLPIVPENRRHETLRLLHGVLSGRGFTDVELQRQKKDGSPITIRVSAALLGTAVNSEKAAVSFNADITEEKQLEAQLLRAQKMEAVGRMAGGIAHDFNNLLTVILGNSNLLLLTQNLDNNSLQLVNEIISTVKRASQLTRQLLAFSRRQISEPRLLSLNDVLLGMEKILRRMIGENVTYSTLLDQNLWPVSADEGQIEQVITNLVINAADAMPNGGRLNIETRNLKLDERFARMHYGITPGDYVLLEVSDTGIGMDAATLELIFEPFFTTKGKDKGTGLGLSTCYAILEQHRGKIYASSKPGQGTKFEIYLPRVEGQAQDAAEKKLDDVEMLGGTEHILLTEDEDAVRLTAHRMLTQAGYSVHEFPDGQKAVEFAEKHGLDDIDMLVTDVVMPLMGGRHLHRNLDKIKPGIKVLYVSGYADDSVMADGMLENGLDLLQKPFTQHELLRRVREILDSTRPEKLMPESN